MSDRNRVRYPKYLVIVPLALLASAPVLAADPNYAFTCSGVETIAISFSENETSTYDSGVGIKVEIVNTAKEPYASVYGATYVNGLVVPLNVSPEKYELAPSHQATVDGLNSFTLDRNSLEISIVVSGKTDDDRPVIAKYQGRCKLPDALLDYYILPQ